MKNGLPWLGYSFQRSKQPLRRRGRLIDVKTFAGKAVVVVITGTQYLRPEGEAYFKKGRKLGKHSESVDVAVASWGGVYKLSKSWSRPSAPKKRSRNAGERSEEEEVVSGRAGLGWPLLPSTSWLRREWSESQRP